MWNSDNQETAEDRENMTYVKIYVALKINEYKVIENGCSFIYTTYENIPDWLPGNVLLAPNR